MRYGVIMKEIKAEDIILYEDEDLLVCHKPAGFPVQSRRMGTMDLESLLRNYLAGKGEQAYVAVIHRLDQPVQGILVFAKNKESAAKLNQQIQQGKMEKWYKAVVCGKPVDNHGVYVDYLRQNQGENRSEIVDKSAAGSKRAELSYTAEASTERCDAGESREYSLVRIRLITGRHHQIRVQFSGHGTPLYGDDKYGEKTAPGQPDLLALCAFRLSFPHPVTGKRMEFEMEPSGGAFEWFKENPS